MVEEEYFWGVQLDSKTKEIEWNPEKSFVKQEKEEGIPIPRHSLMIKQAILSPDVAEGGEVNVVEAEATGYAQSNIKTLIAVLVPGKDLQRALDLVFHDAPVKLRLVKGSGPVHLVGAHGVAYRYVGDDDDDEDGMGEEELDEEELEEEEEDTKPPAKRKKGEDSPAAVKGGSAKRGGKK